MGGEQGRKGDRDIDQHDAADEATAIYSIVARRPAAPTKAMVLAHRVTHAEIRDWFPHCVSGKWVDHQHTSSEKEGGPSAELSV